MGEADAAADEVGTDRAVTLTDGVVAIALTLLALDLKPDLPRSAGSHELAHYLREHAAQYAAFGLAFLIIAQYWLAHHQLMRRVGRATPALHRWTFLFLFGITVAPLTTYLTGNYSNPLASTLFAGNVALVSLSLALLGETVHRQRLDDRTETAAERRSRHVRSAVLLLIPALAGGLVWVVGGGAAWLYLLFLGSGLPGRVAVRGMPA